MKFYYYLVFLLQVIIYVSSLPSEDLWNKTLQYISEGKMILNEKYNYFIFDEENYTSLDINSNEMKSLYDQQKELFSHYSLRTFLFIAQNLNRSIEDAYSIRDNIRNHLIDYGVYINYTVFVLISAETNESILYTGSKIKKSYISDNDAIILNNDIKQYIKNKEYYEALENFLFDIEDYFINKNSNNNNGNSQNFTYNPTYYPTSFHSSNDNSKLSALEIVFVVLIDSVLIIVLIVCCCRCKKNKTCCFKEKKALYGNNNNYNNNSDRNSVGSYGANSIGGNSYSAPSYSAPSYSAPSYGGNSIGGASGGAI